MVRKIAAVLVDYMGTFYSRTAKRAFDILFSFCGILILSPFLILIAFVVRVTTTGPVFYRGVRAGRFGTPFRIYKFRTMVQDAELGPGTTSRNDERVTKIGRFLRLHKLDELPQLLNVLKGEMSFVGPRPELLKYTQKYSGDELLILSIRPGITDLSSLAFADLSSHISDANPDHDYEMLILNKKNELRIKYVKEQSFFRDLVIIFNTIWRVIKIQ